MQFGQGKPKTGLEAVRRKKRILRACSTTVAVVSTCAVAYAIEMNSSADQADAAHTSATRWQKYITTVTAHAVDVEGRYSVLLARYSKAVDDAQRQQARMLADLRKARKAALKAKKPDLAPISYSTSVSYSGGGSVSAASAAAPSSGTS